MSKKPYVWGEDMYRDHIRHVCMTTGEYDGGKQKIYRRSWSDKFPWAILFRSKTIEDSSEMYEELDSAIQDFIAFNPITELKPLE